MAQDTDASPSFYDSGPLGSAGAGQNNSGTRPGSASAGQSNSGTESGAAGTGQNNNGTGQNRYAAHAGSFQAGAYQTGVHQAGSAERANRAGAAYKVSSSEVLADEVTLLTRSGETDMAQKRQAQSDVQNGTRGNARGDTRSGAQGNAQGNARSTARSDTRDGAFAAESAAASEDAGNDDQSAWYVPDTPDGYSFALPSGLEVDERAADQFRDLAHAEGITQGQAQSVANLYAHLMEKQQADQAEALVETERHWLSELRSDRSYSQTVAKARLAMQRYGTPELETLLNDTRLGSHPALVRFVARIGRELAEPDAMPAKSMRASQGLNFYDTMRS